MTFGEKPMEPEAADLNQCRRLIAGGQVREALLAAEALIAGGKESAALRQLYGIALYLTGRARDSLPQFERAQFLDPDQPSIYQNHSMALLACGETDAAIAMARRAVGMRPDNTGGRINLALALIRARNFTEAEEHILAGLQIEPGNLSLMTQAAHVMAETRRFDEAEAFIAPVLSEQPNNLDALFVRAVVLQARNRFEEAAAVYDRVLEISPGHEAAFINKGVALRDSGRAEGARRHFASGLAQRPDWPVLRYNMAVSNLYAGDWTNAWPDFELRFLITPALEKTPVPESPRWQGEDIAGRTLLVIHEQGFGDTFQFIRFLVWASHKAGRVVFLCPSRLHAILSRLTLFRDGQIGLVPDDRPLPAHDLHVPLLSLAGFSGLRPDTVPVVVPRIALEEERVRKWSAFGNPRPGRWRIGLSWQGNPTASIDKGRSIDLAAMAPLGRLARKADFISLQRHFGLEQAAPSGLEILSPSGDFDAGNEAFVDTAAMMISLDMIITSDTAVAHLAGLLGRPVWLFLKQVPDWRWGGEGHLTPWYPTMRLFRQTKSGDWAGLFDQAASELATLIGDPSPYAADASGRISDAIALQSSGRHAEAAKIYRAALPNRSRDAQVYNYLAMAILEDGRRRPDAARGALPFALHSVALRARISDHWSNCAVLFAAMGAQPDARRALGFALAANPDHVPSLLSVARRDVSDGKPSPALDRLLQLNASSAFSASFLSNLASILSDAERKQDALVLLRKAIGLEPQSPKLFVQYGALLDLMGKKSDAQAAWEKALTFDLDNADALSNLGVWERNNGSVELACFFQRTAVEKDPTHAEAWNNLGISELEAGRESEAIAAFRQAVTVRPDYADAHLALGMALLNIGDMTDGFKHYEGRLGSDKLGITAGRPNIPLWRGGDPRGMAFLLMAEQGFGDAFQFSRYASWLKERGARAVYIGCRSRLAHLLRTVPGVDGIVSEGERPPAVDAMVYMMSMPALTGMQVDTIPAYPHYLTPDPDRVMRWAEWLAERPGFRVGIVWQGNPDPKVDRGRSFPLERLEPLARIEGVRLISLQKGAGEEQMAQLGGRFDVESPSGDFDGGSDAFADTAALMMNLDLIVTSDTAVAHLAGALGRPCWVILRARPEWRWLRDRSDSPWYPTMRLFRRVVNEVEQHPFEGVVGRLAAALARLVSGDLSERHLRAPASGVRIVKPDPAKLFNRALELQKGANKEEATALYAECLQYPAVAPNALNMLGALALQNERNARAFHFFAAAEKVGLKKVEFSTNFAIALRRLGRMDSAIERLKSAIAIKETAEAHLSLGNIYRDLFRFVEAEAHYRRAATLKPDMAKAHRGIGNLMRDVHRPEDSLAAFERARALTPDDADLILDHAHAKLFAGDLPGGFLDYEARWLSREMRPRQFSVARWDGQPVAGKTLLVHGEQGFGDNIQFVRFVEEAARRVDRLVLEVREPLIGLFRRMRLSRPIEIVEQGRHSATYDLEVPMLSLPLVFGTTLDTIPPPPVFDLDPTRVQDWRDRFAGSERKVGLIWQGNPNARADAGRSPPLASLMPILKMPGLQFVSLQKTDGLDQVAALSLPKPMIVPGSSLGDFEETAAAIAALDLVISSCTATLHLAASLGVPVFGMLKYHADWRWLNERPDSPWYPSLQLFRQPAPGDWAAVASDIRVVLEGWLSE